MLLKDSVLQLFHEVFGPEATPAPPRPKPKKTTKLSLEALEARDCPSTIWSPQALQGGGYSTDGNNAANYTNGLPTANNPLILDGSTTQRNEPITFSSPLDIGSLTVQNNYQKTLTMNAGANLQTEQNNVINSGSMLTIISNDFNGIELVSGNNFTVQANATLNLSDPPQPAAFTAFITGNGTKGQYLSNSGTVTWSGTAVAQGQPADSDSLGIPVLNKGTFTLDGGTKGNDNAVGGYLTVSFSDPNTNNVSFYQTSGSVNLKNGALLDVTDGYQQTAGSLTSDSTTCELETGGQGNGVSDINIAGGSVSVDTVPNSVGTLRFYADTLEINGQINVSGETQAGGGSTLCDLLDCGMAKVTLGNSSSLVIGTTGSAPLGTGNRWTVMQYASITNPNNPQNPWGSITKPDGMSVSTGPGDVLVSN